MQQLSEGITADPTIMGGKPCVRDTRVTVSTIIGLLATGHTADDIIKSYPYLTAKDIRAALTFAAMQMEAMDVPLAS